MNIFKNINHSTSDSQILNLYKREVKRLQRENEKLKESQKYYYEYESLCKETEQIKKKYEKLISDMEEIKGRYLKELREIGG